MTNRCAVLGLVVALALAGCGGKGAVEELKRSPRPYFYVGDSFAGFDLTEAHGRGGRATFVYGACLLGTCPQALAVENKVCGRERVVVSISAVRFDLYERATAALVPLNASARKAGRPEVVYDRGPLCAPPGFEKLKKSRLPLFYLGPSFGGLGLTFAEAGHGGGNFTYGDCKPPPVDEGSCPVPLEVQNRVCSPRVVDVGVLGVDVQTVAQAGTRLRPLTRAARRARPLIAYQQGPALCP